jgi:molybdopterin/thiamine biosynthesis adenylyltransferase
VLAVTCDRKGDVIMASDNKYDRQMRLWGPAGQVSAVAWRRYLCKLLRPFIRQAAPVAQSQCPAQPRPQKALMESRICLLNAGPTGTETLKNLVLPGCGYICVVDGGLVTETDCANNFFVERAAIGQPRAKVSKHRDMPQDRHLGFS